MATQATLDNLKRKRPFVDEVAEFGGYPMFSWLELSPTDLCNRSCVFCPHASDVAYPNQPLHMDMKLVREIAYQLDAHDFRGTVNLCGYGEPLLHPEITRMVAALPSACRKELTTNGDRLNVHMIRELSRAGLSHIVVSMYDGPEQAKRFRDEFAKAGVPADFYTLRDRWMTSDQDYGLILTNRAGTVGAGQQAPIDISRPCFYLAYSMMVDWNGDVLLCSQDWVKRVKFGNVNQETLLAIWLSPAMRKRRRQLLHGRAGLNPCQGCNANGQVHGANHAAAWQHGSPKREAAE